MLFFCYLPVHYCTLYCSMTRKERYQFVINYFEQHMPVAETELEFKDSFQLLVAVILSAQCTDKRVNLTTPPSLQNIPLQRQ